ncbi:hypothetical protein NMYAN_80119 [Nitrosomonas nitrosa]|uniref:Uncharacterized protein n=1 Tax=Nitrosomonas nitrosa TaxID=52442 RepID=A0A8H9DAA9_9PROT|nr:hypothetical protein NMYAN_80119 [Nitrosomonas nitrosa]
MAVMERESGAKKTIKIASQILTEMLTMLLVISC